MKKINLFLASLFLLIIGSCSKIDTGITGHVKYGEGDCMPVIGKNSNKMDQNYRGIVYFIEKEKLDRLGDGNYDQLKSSSISTTIQGGKLSVELPAGKYLAVPDDFHYYSEDNIVTIKEGKVLRKNISFFNCLSY